MADVRRSSRVVKNRKSALELPGDDRDNDGIRTKQLPSRNLPQTGNFGLYCNIVVSGTDIEH